MQKDHCGMHTVTVSHAGKDFIESGYFDKQALAYLG